MKQKLRIIPLLYVLLCVGHIVKAEDITVRGTVTSVMDEQPLPGVNVVIKGTSVGTVTDIDGNYSLDVPEDAILVFSFIGFLTEEVAVNNQSVIDISMVADITQLEEVIVVGYGEQKKDHVTGSVVQVNAEEIQDLPVGNLSQALVGRLAGVKVGQSTGKPGARNPISIRTSTSYGVGEPVLYVIDGIIYEDGGAQFDMLDASQIESISVLKDAAASIYGARASGGVILVKTKKGEIGKPRISYSASIGIGSPTQIPDMLSAHDQAVMLNEMYDYEHGKYRNDPDYESNKKYDFRYFSPDELDGLDTLDYDWLDDLYKDSYTIRHTLNVSGGTDRVRYFVGGNYFKETGNIESLVYKKYGANANVEADLTNDITLSVGIRVNKGTGEEPYYAEEAQSGVLRDTYKRLLTAPRWTPPSIGGLPVFIQGSWNPYGLIDANNYKSSTSNNTNIIGALEYRLPVIKGLKLKVQYAFNESSGSGKQFSQNYNAYNFVRAGQNKHIFTNELSSEVSVPNREGLYESSDESRFYQINTSISYNRSFGRHNIEALLVYEQEESESNGFNLTTQNAVIKGYDQLWAFSNDGVTFGSNAAESGRLSYIGRVNYDFDEKYIFETAFRYEASQKFHPDYAWGFFPSISAGWLVSKEEFFKDNISFINFLKLRASAGKVGNDNVGAGFQWKQSYGANEDGPIFGTSLTNAIDVKNNGISTPTLTWQKTNSYNIGLNTRFLENKIDFSVDYYYRYTYDILDRRSASPITLGVDKPPRENYGIMFGKGLEFQLGYKNKLGNDFHYSVKGNFSWDYARPLKIIQSAATIGRWDDPLLNSRSNQPGWTALGMIRTQEDLEHVLNMYDSIDGEPVGLGMIYYKDIHGENYSEGPDGKLDDWDKSIIAEYTSPPYNYGFSIGASWKGLSLNATFSGQFGHKTFIQKDEQILPTESANVFAFWGDYWTPDNRDASMPRPYEFGLMEQHSTFWMRDGHTLRLNNINLAYTLPASLLEKWNLPEFRMYFTGTNIWTIISPFDHKDPAVSRAYDYPLIKTYSFGLNVNF